MRRLLLLAFLAAVGAFFLWPMGGSGRAKPGQRELVVWGVNLGPDSKGPEAVIREFERRNPDIKVRTLSMGAGRRDPQKLMTSIVGNVAPDVILEDRFTIADWASRGAFQSLDGFIARDRSVDPDTPTEDRFYASAWREAMYEGSVYAIPTSADNRLLYWNKGLFREKARELRAAGLDPNRAPRTWSDLLAYSRVLTERGPDGRLHRVGFMPLFGDSWLYLYAFQNNAPFMSEDGRRCTLNTPEVAEALAFIAKGYEEVGGADAARAFEAGFQSNENDPFIVGKVAMKIHGDWILNGLTRFGPQLELGAAPAPVPDDRYYKRGRFKYEKDTFVTWSGGHCMAIPRGARNAEDAWKYLKFASSTAGWLIEAEAQRDWERKKGRPYLPYQVANIAANEERFRRFRPADTKYAEALRMHIDMAKFARTRPPTFAGSLLWFEHIKATEAVVTKQSSPERALASAQASVQRELDARFGQDAHPVVDKRWPAALGAFAALGMLVALFVGYRRARIGRIGRQEARWAYLFLAPCIAGFLILTLGPMVASLYFSFTQYDVLNEARWVGGKNYADLVVADRETVLKAFSNVGYLAFFGVPLSLFTGLAIALLLNTATRGIRFYRTFFYMPAIVPAIAGVALWTWVLNADPSKGLVNSAWQKTLTAWLGLPPPVWLGSAEWSKDELILMGLWGAGSGMILWLAGLKGVPASLYEAASLDGADSRKSFWAITVPQLSPILFFNAVIGFIAVLQEFDRMFILSPSSVGTIGPNDSLLSPVFLLFRHGFAYFRMGYASAIAWAIFAVILVLTLIQFRLAPKWVHYEVDA